MAGKVGTRDQHTGMHFDPDAKEGRWQHYCWCMCSKCFQTFGLTSPRRQKGVTIAESLNARRPFGKCICPTCPCRRAEDEALLNSLRSRPQTQAAQDAAAARQGKEEHKHRQRKGPGERRSAAQDQIEKMVRAEETRRALVT